MSTSTHPVPNLADPRVRRAMKALTETGHYEETADSFEWLAMEAQDVADLCDQFPDRMEEEVYALLTNTGLHDATDPTEDACLRRDAARVAAAMGALGEGVAHGWQTGTMSDSGYVAACTCGWLGQAWPRPMQAQSEYLSHVGRN